MTAVSSSPAASGSAASASASAGRSSGCSGSASSSSGWNATVRSISLRASGPSAASSRATAAYGSVSESSSATVSPVDSASRLGDGVGVGVGGEAIGRGPGQGQELAGEILGVGDDPLALQPDPVGVGVQVLDPLLGVLGDLCGLDARLREPILGLAARLRGDLLGRLVRALQDPRDLLAHPLERPAHRRLRRPRRLQLGHEPAGLAHVLVNGHAVVPAQHGWEVSVDDRERIDGSASRGRVISARIACSVAAEL